MYCMPTLFREKSILLSSHASTLSVRGEGFHASMSGGVAKLFSDEAAGLLIQFRPRRRATAQMELLQRCLGSLPPYPHTFFRYVHLTHVVARHPKDIRCLLTNIVLLTRCPNVTLSDVTGVEAPQRTSVSRSRRKITSEDACGRTSHH